MRRIQAVSPALVLLLLPIVPAAAPVPAPPPEDPAAQDAPGADQTKPEPPKGTKAEVTLDLPGGSVVVAGLSVEGRTYFSLRGAAAAVGGTVATDTDGTVRLTSEAGEVAFSVDMPSLASVAGTIVSLPAPVLLRGGDVYVPVEALERLVSVLEPQAAPEAPEGALPVEVQIAGGADELRVVIEAAEALSPALEGGGDEITVTFGEGVFLRPPYARRSLGGALLDEIRFEQTPSGTVLRITAGPGLRTARLETPGGGSRVEVVIGGVPVRSRRSFFGAAGEAVLKTVVVDPGHGGEEDGAVGPGGVKEKDVTLRVAEKLRSALATEGFEAHLTRSDDRDLGLDERAAIANNRQADLFVSLHANASPGTKARGAETYFLAREATDDAARTTAALENDAARRGRRARSDPEGLDLVLWDLAQVEYLEESAALAETIQKELDRALDLADRGVRQAPFRVLMGATMPAVLVEMGFLSNEDEAARLADDAYQARIAGAIARAVVAFRDAYERRLGAAPRGHTR